MSEKNFVNGMIVKDAKPDFIKCKLSVKCGEFLEYMKQNAKDGWLNIEIKEARSGKLYAELDTWEPSKSGGQNASFGNSTPTEPVNFGNSSDVPF